MKRFTQLVENSKPICEKLIKVLDGKQDASLEAKATTVLGKVKAP